MIKKKLLECKCTRFFRNFVPTYAFLNMKRHIIIALLATLCSVGASAQKISFDHQTVTTPTTLWRRPVTATFRYTNKDREPLQVTAVDGGCGCIDVQWDKSPLERGNEAEIKVTYDAKLLGKFDKQIDVYTNASDKPVRIRMKGNVSNGDKKTLADLYPYNIGDIMLNANEVQFSAVHAGDSATATIEYVNNSQEVFTPQLMHLPAYITAKFKPEMVARGRRGEIELTLHSDKLPDLGLNQTSIYLARFFGDKVGNGNDIVVSSILLPDLTMMEHSSNVAKMHLSTTEVNLGKMDKKSKLVGKVRITNRGSVPLSLSKVQAFNQAVSVALDRTEIPSGQTVEMKITVDRRFLEMSKARPRVLIISNDPQHSMEVINVNYEK